MKIKDGGSGSAVIREEEGRQVLKAADLMIGDQQRQPGDGAFREPFRRNVRPAAGNSGCPNSDWS